MKTLKATLSFFVLSSIFCIHSNAQIVYTNIPDTTLSGIKTFYIDLNNDGINDFKFITQKPSSSCKTCGGSSNWPFSFSVSIVSLNSNKVLDTANYPVVLINNVLINKNSLTWQTGTQLMYNYSRSCYTSCILYHEGNWLNQTDKYIGVKLLKNGIKYYGWIRVSVSGSSITIKDYAYDRTPNHSIHAGATSGARLSANGVTSHISHGKFQLPFHQNNHVVPDYSSFLENQNNPASRQRGSSICSQKTYGGSNDEYFGYVLKLRDGNYMLYGNSDSGDDDFSNNHGEDDAYLIKINTAGNILWSRTYGGSDEDGFNQIIEAPNGDIIAAGYTESNDGDVSGNHGGFDGWFVILGKNGNIKSQHCFGGSADDYFEAITKGNNNSYMIAGIVGSDDGDVSGAGNHGGEADAWVVKLNHNGSMAWQRCIGGSDFEQFQSIISINNKYYVSGVTFSFDGDATQNHSSAGHFDQFLAKVKSNGDIVWVACHGGSDDDYCINQSLAVTTDGNIINVGTTLSNDGDVSGRVNTADAWVPKISANTGALISQRCYGSATRQQSLYSVLRTHDGGFLLVGADAYDFFVDTSWNAMVIKTDRNGNEIWKKTFGGSDQDVVDGITVADNGDYLLACYSRSSDGDVTNQHGNGDIWMVRLGSCCGNNNRELEINAENNFFDVSLKCFPNPLSQPTIISWQLAKSENVLMQIFDINGKLVATLANGEFNEGKHQIEFNAEKINAGIYFLKMQAGEFLKTEKLIVTK